MGRRGGGGDAVTSPWDRLVGQDHAVALLQRAVDRPVHAYLLVGPRGSGVEDAARVFAACLVAGEGDDRAVDLALRGMHPDVVEFEPEGVSYRVKEDVRQGIIPEALRSPVEGARKVIVVHEADRLSANRAVAANALLKTIEEPPDRTVMVLVTAAADDLPETVRSRCQRIDLDPLSSATVEAALIADGVAPDAARLAATLAGGQLGRARSLAGPGRELRAAFVAAARSLDGHAGTAIGAAESLTERIDASLAALKDAHGEAAEAFAAELAAAGYPDRSASALRNRLAERHKREQTAAKRRALAEGITALESCYRDALAGPDAPARNLDGTGPIVGPTEAVAAIDACRAARASLGRNPNPALCLEALLVALPAAR